LEEGGVFRLGWWEKEGVEEAEGMEEGEAEGGETEGGGGVMRRYGIDFVTG
jgi:hypothetical protein